MTASNAGADQPADWQARSRSFDRVADLYDAHRPDYPEALVESVIALAGLRPGDKILEIGSGTGKATAPFARRGFSILCIEPGRDLAAVAARKAADYPAVAFEAVRFEDWPEPQAEFDLVMAAQAFHWVPKEVGYAKAARALKPGGHLALFWNRNPGPQGEIFSDLERVYQERAPELFEAPTACEEDENQRTLDDITASGRFGPVQMQKFPWSARYDARQYLGLLNTYSDHLALPEATRASLFEGVAQVIERHGGTIERPYVAVLYVAAKALTPGP
jgi:SAM-dependent methyltransferase